jgi:hypothetical protein
VAQGGLGASVLPRVYLQVYTFGYIRLPFDGAAAQKVDGLA